MCDFTFKTYTNACTHFIYMVELFESPSHTLTHARAPKVRTSTSFLKARKNFCYSHNRLLCNIRSAPNTSTHHFLMGKMCVCLGDVFSSASNE